MHSSVESPYKSLFVNYSLGMGGIETLLLELCRHMKADGNIDPAVCVFEQKGKIRNEFESMGIRASFITY